MKSRTAVHLPLAVVLAIAGPGPAARCVTAQSPDAGTFRESVEVGLVTVDRRLP